MMKRTTHPRRTARDDGPHAVDLHVGERIQLRRKLFGMTQGRLAGKIGVSFQQLQKYERGYNRVSASMLYEIGKALGVPVGFFFADYNDPEPGPDISTEPFHSTVSLHLLAALNRLSADQRDALLALVASMGRRG